MEAALNHLSGGTELDARRLARCYSSLGWYVTPLNGKKPYQKDWPSTASKGEPSIANWAGAGNIGLVTGEGSGVVVIDIDPRNGGDDGLVLLETECGPLPETLVCLTGGGGRHLYFRYWQGAKSAKPVPGIDFQSDRHCVVLPPSKHPETGSLYEWQGVINSDDIAELPEAWKRALISPQAPREAPEIDSSEEPIPEGVRNETLFKLAVKLAKGGASESRISREVTEANELRCQPPVEIVEIEQIVRRSLRYREGNQSLKTRFQVAVGYADIPTARKAALWALALFADQHGRNCYPTIAQIADRSGLNRKSNRANTLPLHKLMVGLPDSLMVGLVGPDLTTATT